MEFNFIHSQSILQDQVIYQKKIYIIGLVLNKKTKWVVFHGSSDFAYLLRLVLGE
jgi:hypothetical protein